MTDATAPGQPDPLDVAVGARIRLRRKQRGISQAALADVLGLTFQQVQKYERGTNRVSASTLIRISQHLDASPNDLLGVTEGGSGVDWLTFGTKGTPELIDAYSKLASPAARKAVLRLIRDLANGEDE